MKLKRNLETKDIKRIILDTDTYNEVDDQFALALCGYASAN